jgi:hypothetical protein
MSRKDVERGFYKLVLEKPQDHSPEIVRQAMEMATMDFIGSLATGKGLPPGAPPPGCQIS